MKDDTGDALVYFQFEITFSFKKIKGASGRSRKLARLTPLLTFRRTRIENGNKTTFRERPLAGLSNNTYQIRSFRRILVKPFDDLP